MGKIACDAYLCSVCLQIFCFSEGIDSHLQNTAQCFNGAWSLYSLSTTEKLPTCALCLSQFLNEAAFAKHDTCYKGMFLVELIQRKSVLKEDRAKAAKEAAVAATATSNSSSSNDTEPATTSSS